MAKWQNHHFIEEDQNPLWIVKRNELVRAKFNQKLRVESFQILSYLLAQINPKKKLNTRVFSFTKAELCRELKGAIDDSRFYKEVVDILDELLNIKIKLQKMDKEKGETGDFININMFSAAALVEGKIYFKLTDDIEPYISSIDQFFTKTQDIQVRKIRNFGGYRLYELCSMHTRDDKEYAHFTIEIEELKDQLGIPGKYKGRFDNFKKRAIEPAIKEVNKTDYKCEYEPIKNGRKTSHIKFHLWQKTGIEKKYDFSVDDLKDCLNYREQLELIMTKHDQKAIYEGLQKGVLTHMHIESNITYFMDRLDDPSCPKIENPSKYLKKTILENYANHEQEKDWTDTSWADGINFDEP